MLYKKFTQLHPDGDAVTFYAKHVTPGKTPFFDRYKTEILGFIEPYATGYGIFEFFAGEEEEENRLIEVLPDFTAALQKAKEYFAVQD